MKLQAQVVTGTINDAVSLEPLDFVTVFVRGTNVAAESDLKGFFNIEVPADAAFELVFRRVGYAEKGINLGPLSKGDSLYQAIVLDASDMGIEVEVRADAIDNDGLIRED